MTMAVKPEEHEVFTFTLKDETDILTPLPCDAQRSNFVSHNLSPLHNITTCS
jgi:hypothetical protein